MTSLKVIFISTDPLDDFYPQNVRIRSLASGFRIHGYQPIIVVPFCNAHIPDSFDKIYTASQVTKRCSFPTVQAQNRSFTCNLRETLIQKPIRKFLLCMIAFRAILDVSHSRSLIYLNSNCPVVNVSVSLFAKVLSIPILCDLGEWPKPLPKTFNLAYSLRQYWHYASILSSVILGSVSVCITNEIALKVKKTWRSARTFVVPALIPIAYTVNSVEESIQKHPKSDQLFIFNHLKGICKLRLFYMGTLKEEDGFSKILAAFRSYKLLRDKCVLVIAGYFDPHLLDSLAHPDDFLVNSSKGFMINFGFVDSAILPSLVDICDGVLLLRDEHYGANTSFPTRLPFFLQKSRVVITSSVGDIPLYLRAGVDFIDCNPITIENIFKSLFHFADMNKTERLSISTSAFERSRQVFDPGYQVGRLLEYLLPL